MKQYPIGTIGQPWTDIEKKQWFEGQQVKRSYYRDVLLQYEDISEDFKKFQYGALPINEDKYPLFVFTSFLDMHKPNVLITGGVHGYETSGVQGAIRFLLTKAADYLDTFNFIIAPCVSPWGYETINRWNPDTIDPNRSFHPTTTATEPKAIIDFVSVLEPELLAHFDLHETTNTDDTEFRPALAAKNGTEFSEWDIPDGFYTVADTANPTLDFQKAIIDNVKSVTHIAPSDSENKIIGTDTISDGVICYDKKSLFLCGGFTNAKYVTTTEVYPDSNSITPEQCILAQLAAIEGGLNFLKTVI